MPTFKIINPETNKTTEKRTFEPLTQSQSKAKQLQQSYKEWRKYSYKKRSAIILNLGQFLKKHHVDIAKLITEDMGKPISESTIEVQKCIDCCNYYANHHQNISNLMITDHGFRTPVGVILGIMPWNFPLWQIIRFIIPSLIVGNTCLVKPAPNTVRIAEFLQSFFKTTSPLIVDCCIPTNAHTEKLITDDNINGVSFTGSVAAGQQVGKLSTEHLKPCVLELGGSDPFIVFDDGNLNAAIDTAVLSRFLNCGQACNAAKRFYFQTGIFNDALQLMIKKTSEFLTYGSPNDTSTTIGPLARADIKQRLDDQVTRSNLNKKQIAYQYSGDLPSKNHAPAMIIDGTTIKSPSPLLSEEVFGPIAICCPFKTVDDAITLANQTEFGLGATIWSSNTQTQNTCINDINSGTIAINGLLKSQIHAPFGGVKKSGLGIELGLEGALSFTVHKTIINH